MGSAHFTRIGRIVVSRQRYRGGADDEHRCREGGPGLGQHIWNLHLSFSCTPRRLKYWQNCDIATHHFLIWNFRLLYYRPPRKMRAGKNT
jgi:hypothetical protein